MKKKQILTYSLMLAMALMAALYAVAQPPSTPGDPGGNNTPLGAIPIDGGLALLAAAGIGYGAKKAYDSKKKNGKEKEL